MVLARLQRAWGWYQSQLVRRPVRTQVVTSAILWAAGDGVAQQVDIRMSERRRRKQAALDGDLHCSAAVPGAWEQGDKAHPRLHPGAHAAAGGVPENSHRPPPLDLARICTTGIFGGAFVGPVGHFWYAGLEHFVKHTLRLRPKSTPFIVSKLVLDTAIFGPVHLIAFFSWTGLVSGHPLQQIQRDVARDFVPAILTEATVWPVIQFANFRFVPVQHQLLFVNLFCLIDSAWLSWLKYEEDAPWKRALLNLMPWATKL